MSTLIATKELLTKGFTILNADARLTLLAEAVFEAGERFFALDSSIKNEYANSSLLEGYRPVGKEYSQSPERPDLTESFSLWLHNMSWEKGISWSTLDLYARISDISDIYCQLADSILNSLRKELNPSGDVIHFKDSSYLQLNYYKPSTHDRDFLQDSHEDGHLLTFVTATEKGLEIEADGQFESVSFRKGQILVIPGSLLTIMTGGRVQPMYHRVRNHREISLRQSLMFFINPSLNINLAPWISNDFNKGLDIRKMADANSALFGLSALSEILDK